MIAIFAIAGSKHYD